jgi:hypothetical protein
MLAQHEYVEPADVQDTEGKFAREFACSRRQFVHYVGSGVTCTHCFDGLPPSGMLVLFVLGG